MSDSAMIFVGGNAGSIEAASKAIISVLNAAGTEAASVAAMNCLTELARAPTHTTISGCHFTNAPTPRKRKS